MFQIAAAYNGKRAVAVIDHRADILVTETETVQIFSRNGFVAVFVDP